MAEIKFLIKDNEREKDMPVMVLTAQDQSLNRNLEIATWEARQEGAPAKENSSLMDDQRLITDAKYGKLAVTVPPSSEKLKWYSVD